MKGNQDGLFGDVPQQSYRRRWRMSDEDRRLKQNESSRKSRVANFEKMNEAAKRRRDAVAKELRERLGNKCACCGATENLVIDHVGGDGAEDRAEYSVGRKEIAAIPYYVFLRRLKDGTQARPIQLLCQSCNNRKGNLQHCPCKRRRLG